MGSFFVLFHLDILIFSIMCSNRLHMETYGNRNQSLSRFIKLRESIDFQTLRAWQPVWKWGLILQSSHKVVDVDVAAVVVVASKW